MKIALITDTHFGGRNDSQIFDKYFAKFYENIFFPKLDELGIKQVIHLGDTFDRRKYINFNTLNSCRDYFFQPLADREIKVDMIVGNHDAYYKNKIDVNSTRLLLGEFSNINAIDRPQTLTYDGFHICMIPWICKDNYEESMEVLAKTKASTVMGHLELKGFGMYKGEHNEHGYEREIFDRFNLVCTGHFHHKDTQGHIAYLGSPYEMTWSDFDDIRGFHIFDTETQELSFIVNPYRMFHKIYYNDVTDDVDDLLLSDFSMYEGAMVKLVIQEKSNVFAFSKVVEKLDNVNPADVTYIDDSLDLSLDTEDLGDIEDTPTLIRAKVEQLPQKHLHKPLKKLMINLHHEAINQTRL